MPQTLEMAQDVGMSLRVTLRVIWKSGEYPQPTSGPYLHLVKVTSGIYVNEPHWFFLNEGEF